MDKIKTSLEFLKSKRISPVLRTKRLWLVALVLVLAGVFVAIPATPENSPPSGGIKSGEIATMGQNGAPASISLSSEELKKTYTSPVYETDYEFNAIAPHWKEVNGGDGARVVEVRASMNNQDWSEWLEIEAAGPLRENEPHPDRTFTENPLFIEGKHFQYRLSLTRQNLAAASPEIADLKMTYLDSRKPPDSNSQKAVKKLSQLKAQLMPKALAGDHGPHIITRAEWGSPDPYGGLYDGTDMDWPPAGSPVSQVFIHHTVNANYQSDPASVVRGIWEFHTKTRGWGDIGYNFLVDNNGTIYEGRTGGDNIVGGHTLDYNRGSLGVAAIGCFDNSSTCRALNGANSSSPSTSMLHGLTELLAWKTTNYEINPQATHNFCSTGGCLDLFTISGHRDANQTSCPGQLLYDSLTFIRNETARKKAAYSYGYSAKQLSYNTVNLSPGTDKSVTLQFKNTGTAAWSNTNDKIILKTANPDGRGSGFRGTGWYDDSTPAVLNEANVPPGAVGSFTFNMRQADTISGKAYEAFRLVSESGDIRAFYTLPISGPVYSSEYAGQGPYPVIIKGYNHGASLSYKNTGNQPWYDDTSLGGAPAGTKPVHLATSHPINRGSAFGSSWGGHQNRPAMNFTTVYENDGTTLAANQHVVQVGQIAKFNFTLAAPLSLPAGTYREYFQPVVEGGPLMNDPGTYLEVTAEDIRFSSAYKSQSAYPEMLPGSGNNTMWIEYWNTGNQPWYDDTSLGGAPAGTKPVHLATSHPINRGSAFGSSWGGHQNRPAMNFEAVYQNNGTAYGANPHIVRPGEAVRFKFDVSAPFTLPADTYREYFQPVVEGVTVMNDPGTYLDMKVNSPVYVSQFAGQCPYPTLIKGGSAQSCFISYKNTGNQPWYDDTSLGGAPAGTKPVHLATSHPINRGSAFGSSWGSHQNRPAVNFSTVYESNGVTLAANQHIVQEGQIAKFNFTLSAPLSLAAGTYREYFQPVVEGGPLMNDPGTYLDVAANN